MIPKVSFSSKLHFKISNSLRKFLSVKAQNVVILNILLQDCQLEQNSPPQIILNCRRQEIRLPICYPLLHKNQSKQNENSIIKVNN